MKEFNKDNLNKACSMYIFEQNKETKTIQNEEVYSLLRYVITGNPVGPPLGEIADILG